MKKITLLLISLCANGFAMSNVDFTTQNFYCGGKLINQSSTIQQLMSTCNNTKLVQHEDSTEGRDPDRNSRGGDDDDMTYNDDDDNNEVLLDQVKLYTDNNSYMICYFNSKQILKKCKVTLSNKPTASK